MLHVLLLLEEASSEVLAVCRSATGVMTAASRHRLAVPRAADGKTLDVDALGAALDQTDELRLLFPQGGAMVVRRVRLEQ